KESTFEVDGNSGVEVLYRHLLGRILGADADIVDQHIDAAEMRTRRRNRAPDLIEPSEVHLQRQRAAAHGLDLTDEAAVDGCITKSEREVGSGIGTGERTGAADAARGTRDKYDLVLQIEARKSVSHGNLPSKSDVESATLGQPPAVCSALDQTAL